MAVYRILGQGFPSANISEILYSPPPGKQCVLSTIQVCNQDKVSGTFKVALVLSGESLATTGKQYHYYNEPIRGERSFAVTTGITLSEGDAIYIQSSNGAMSFNLSGWETTA